MGFSEGASKVQLAAPDSDVAYLAEVLDPVLATSGASRVMAAEARFDEPRSPRWLRLTVDWPAATREEIDTLMPRIVTAIEMATPRPIQATLMSSDPCREWLALNGMVVWQRFATGS